MKVTGRNIILHGVSGKFGDQLVIRQRKGRIVIAAVPKKSVKPSTPARKKQMSKFSEAVAFAKRVKADPALLDQCQIRVKPNQSIYHAAISAFMAWE